MKKTVSVLIVVLLVLSSFALAVGDTSDCNWWCTVKGWFGGDSALVGKATGDVDDDGVADGVDNCIDTRNPDQADSDYLSKNTCDTLGWETDNSFTNNDLNTVCGASFILGGCSSYKTYLEAKLFCESEGARLCTVEELRNDETIKTGCSYDNLNVWTRSTCSTGYLTRKGATRNGATTATDGTLTNSDEPCTSITSTAFVRCCADTINAGRDDLGDACDVNNYCFSGTDTDSDGTSDLCDSCPSDALNDVDNDGFCGSIDNCPLVSNSEQADADQDGISNVCDLDADDDDICGNCFTTGDVCKCNSWISFGTITECTPSPSGSGSPPNCIFRTTDSNSLPVDKYDNCPLIKNGAVDVATCFDNNIGGIFDDCNQINTDGEIEHEQAATIPSLLILPGDACDDDDDDDGDIDSQDCKPLDKFIFHGASELCDGVDNNCDGTIDEGCTCTPPGKTQSCGPPNELGECSFGIETCNLAGEWGECIGAVYPALSENCGNNKDDNCDGQTDCNDDDCKTIDPQCVREKYRVACDSETDTGDIDRDGYLNCVDNCESVKNGATGTNCADSTGLTCNQKDSDRDGFGDACDNCQTYWNPDQTKNIDGDAFGDICDLDDDGDGILEDDGDGKTDLCANGITSGCDDNCPLIANGDSDGKCADTSLLKLSCNQANHDTDLNGDACDTDDDNDGFLDINDNCPTVMNGQILSLCKDAATKFK